MVNWLPFGAGMTIGTPESGNRAGGSILRFGPFEVDLRAAEMRKNGTRIRLQDQPFQILRILLERQGQVVTREEIQKRLWPDNTIVEFDHSINAAVRRLRDALQVEFFWESPLPALARQEAPSPWWPGRG